MQGLTMLARGRTDRRAFTFEVVRPIARGAQRPAQVGREHGLAERRRRRWRSEYHAPGAAAFLPGPQTADERRTRRVADREPFCDQLALFCDQLALEKVV